MGKHRIRTTTAITLGAAGFMLAIAGGAVAGELNPINGTRGDDTLRGTAAADDSSGY